MFRAKMFWWSLCFLIFSFLSLGYLSNQDLPLQHKQPGDVKLFLIMIFFRFHLGKAGTLLICAVNKHSPNFQPSSSHDFVH